MPFNCEYNHFKDQIINLSNCDLENQQIKANLQIQANSAEKNGIKRLFSGSKESQLNKALENINKNLIVFENDIKSDRQFINAALKLIINIKEDLNYNSPDDIKIRDTLKKVKNQIFKIIKKDEIAIQRKQIEILKNKFNQCKNQLKSTHGEQAVQFLQGLLDGWQEYNLKNRPIVMPVWFHVTESINSFESILKDGQIIQSQAVRGKGAYVSSQAEFGDRFSGGYGEYGLALDSSIEMRSTEAAEQVLFEGKVFHESNALEAAEKAGTEIKNGRVWLKFKSNIKVNRQSKFKDPFSYYFERSLAYMTYKPNDISEAIDGKELNIIVDKTARVKRNRKAKRKGYDELSANELGRLTAKESIAIPHNYSEAVQQLLHAAFPVNVVKRK